MALAVIVLLGLFQYGSASRDLLSHESNASTFEGSLYQLPKKCSGSYWDSDNCCTCTSPNGNSWMELGVKVKSCASLDKQSNKMCCETWATDCDEDDPWYQRAFERECSTAADGCSRNECSEVDDQLKLIEKQVDEIKHRRKSYKTIKSRFITGVKDKSYCGCGCGKSPEAVDASKNASQPMCAAKKGFICTELFRPCCVALEDCEANDPWPKAVAKDERKITWKISQRKTQEAEGIRQRGALLQIEHTCLNQCKDQRRAQCLADLKKTNSNGKTNQYVRTLAKWQQLKDAQDRRESDMQLIADEIEERMESARVEREKLLDAERRRKQLVRLHGWVTDLRKVVNKTVDDILIGTECCYCMTETGFLLTWKLAVDYCTARNCRAAAKDVPGRKCEAVAATACASRRETAC